MFMESVVAAMVVVELKVELDSAAKEDQEFD